MSGKIAKPKRLNSEVKDLAQKMAGKLPAGEWLYIVSSSKKDITFKLRSGHIGQNASKVDPNKAFSGVAKVLPTETAWIAYPIPAEKAPEPKAEKQPEPEKIKPSWKQPEKDGKGGEKQ